MFDLKFLFCLCVVVIVNSLVFFFFVLFCFVFFVLFCFVFFVLFCFVLFYFCFWLLFLIFVCFLVAFFVCCLFVCLLFCLLFVCLLCFVYLFVLLCFCFYIQKQKVHIHLQNPYYNAAILQIYIPHSTRKYASGKRKIYTLLSILWIRLQQQNYTSIQETGKPVHVTFYIFSRSTSMQETENEHNSAHFQ